MAGFARAVQPLRDEIHEIRQSTATVNRYNTPGTPLSLHAEQDPTRHKRGRKSTGGGAARSGSRVSKLASSLPASLPPSPIDTASWTIPTSTFPDIIGSDIDTRSIPPPSDRDVVTPEEKELITYVKMVQHIRIINYPFPTWVNIPQQECIGTQVSIPWIIDCARQLMAVTDKGVTVPGKVSFNE